MSAPYIRDVHRMTSYLKNYFYLHTENTESLSLSAMDLLGVSTKGGKRSHTKRSKKAIKVVYISSPMKVKTSASEFRALVQELTGKDSDAERFLDINGALNSPGVPHQTEAGYDRRASMFPLTDSCHDDSPSTTSSESFLESLDGFPSMEAGGFMGMLQSSLFHESFQLDVLN
ncbi:hypothetical protein OIU76_003459 [Salix suchowensis]|uniref:VQ domain-containing protein n=1 Tax=Salix suchowensis TaxID=1278906 RepID=A0ABQ9BQA6_9ROSI|nr:sigma factor binding protein [Salix suchowensis]KAJ6326071.1 hypothetical protein OIU78_013213 [Salix suchowensis]KAJ6346783.1 hypothetical protein OIU76_003459 [Salix suchowensis]KAJ6387965.1 hypothetical protein OIU77_026513 [Salix suchowensis]